MNYSSTSGSLLANDRIINSTGLTVAGDNVIEGLTTAFNLLTQASSSMLAVFAAIFTSTTWHVMRFFLLRVPSWVVVSSSVSITLSFYTLLLVLLTIMFATYYVLSGRFLHAYKRLQPDDSDERLLKDKKFRDETEALFTNKSESQRKGGFTSYLDEFLSAIKIFGYLEKPVFHELTKSMKTRRLEEGEVLLVDDALGFAIVVEGSLQTYHKVQRTSKNLTGGIPDFLDGSNSDSFDDAASDCDAYSLNGEKYQLLNIVRAGNPVSSLVSILRLFTGRNDTPLSNSVSSFPTSEDGDPGFMSPFLDSTLENHASELRNTGRTQRPTQEQLDSDPRSPNTESNRGEAKSRPENTIPFEGSLPDIIACASGDCTIAIIPASAFRRLISKFPRSASHIIQMVLTKLYRVTFQTAHNYLGLTKEIINTEVVLNRSNNIELPYYLKEAAIRKIKAQKLFKEEEQLKNPKTGPKTRSPIGKSSSKGRVSPHSFLKNRGSRHVVLDSRDHLNPGDLLSNVPLSRKETPAIRGMPGNSVYQSESVKSKSFRNSNTQVSAQLSSLSSLSDKTKTKNKSGKSSALSAATNEDDEVRARTFSAAQEETEESSWRIALVEGMFSYLGITKENILPTTDDDEDALSLRRSSEVSLTPSSQMGAPSAFRLLSPDQFVTKKGPKVKPKPEYKEEIPYNIDFDTVKDEFAQGLQTMFVSEGSILVSQNSHNKGLYYIISGTMEVIWTNEEDHTQHILHNIRSGGIAGYLASLIGSKSFVTLRAKTDLYVGFLPVPTLERLCDKYFMIYLRIAETLINLLNPKILKLDYALEWIHLDASEILFNQDEPANAIYVVLSGRLRQLHRSNKTEPEALERRNKKKHLRDSSKVRAIREYAQGESLGEVDVLTAINRLSTVVALRDTELARIPRTLFELLAMEHPSIMIRVSRLVARKILQQQRGSEAPESINSAKDDKYDFNLLIPPTETTKGSVINSEHGASAPSDGDSRHSYRTITILPITQGLPVEEFASKLVTALKQVGMSTIGLNQSATLSHLGRHAFDGLSKLKQSGYFAELEEIYDTVVYIADTPTNSSWTTTCINQGDCILLLAHSAMTPDIGEFERLLIKSKSNARIELILLHSERYVEPGLTHKWLKNRMWVHSHHHMQFSSPSYVRDKGPEAEPVSNTKTFISNLKRQRLNHITRQTQENISRLLPDSLKSTVENFSSRFINKKSRFYTPVLSHKNDFLRLARILSGKAIGLVLGGGGARGISHLGVLRAIEEHGIPIDMIGGTSIGAFVGGLYAKDYDLVPIYGRMKKFAGRVGSVWRLLTDLTWPVTSYTTGHEFNRGIWKTFGDIRIEDFWIQYYCNSTNITESIQEIHSTGYAWRYIRASMSLAGLLPPIEDNGSMLLDGGYVDNLPVWEMKARGCNTIFAIDVGSVDDRTPQRYGDSLNGFWIVFNRWNPFSEYPNIPNMTEIQMRLGYVASVNALEKAKNTPGVIYARPPIEDYATLDFAKFEEIYQVGTAYGHDFFQELEKQNKMPHIPGSDMLADDAESRHRMLYRRNSV